MKMRISVVVVVLAMMGVTIARVEAQREPRPIQPSIQSEKEAQREQRPIQRIPGSVEPELGKRRPAMPASDPPGARYYSIPPYDFTKSVFSFDDFQQTWIHGSSVGLEYGKEILTSTSFFGAGVHLPDGALIWGWRAWVRDDNPNTGCAISLQKRAFTSPKFDLIGDVHGSGKERASTEVMLLQETSLNETVENKRYYYIISYSVASGAIKLLGVVIVYTMPDVANEKKTPIGGQSRDRLDGGADTRQPQ